MDIRYINMGADVEFFLKRDGKIIGAEKVINSSNAIPNGLIKDGVQAEINPEANTCRQLFSNNICSLFYGIENFLNIHSLKADFSSNIMVPKDEFESLSPESKQFGCSPDYNVYNNCAANIKMDGSTTRRRTAGGHIHFGFDRIFLDIKIGEIVHKNLEVSGYLLQNKINIHEALRKIPENDVEFINLLKSKISYLQNGAELLKIHYNSFSAPCLHPEILIPLLDLMVGIPSVLVDRDKNAANRRKYYGKAGDFRYQPHGIEYRTLSNFWIKDPILLSLFFALALL